MTQNIREQTGLRINSQTIEDTQVGYTSHQTASDPIHFVLEHFRLYTFGFEHVSHLVHLHVSHHVHLHVCHHVSHRNIVSTLLEVSETLTEPKSESVMDRRTDRGRCCRHLRV